MGVYHDLSRGTTAGRSARCRLQRAILTTSIMHQVAKGYIRGACAEIREGGETSPRADSFGGTNMELWARGMTIVGVMNRVLQWAQETEC